MPLRGTPFDVDANFYIPEFLWNFWVESCPDIKNNAFDTTLFSPVGLHLYDTYDNVLNAGLSDHPYSADIFDQIARFEPELTQHPIWETANAAFRTLEKDAETALRSLLQQADAKTRTAGAQTHTYGVANFMKPGQSRAVLDKLKLSLGPHALQSLRKYLIFLRFRNCRLYGKLLKLASEHSLFLRKRGTPSSPKHEPVRLGDEKVVPLSDWVELLKSFTCFFTGLAADRCETFDFVCECIHRRYSNIQDAEICLGVASTPAEYIMSASCFGVIEEGGVGNHEETFHYFFPVSPRFAVYLLIEAPLANSTEDRHRPHFLHPYAKIPSTIDHDVEASIDVYQRNALLLQTLPRYVIFISARSMIRTLTYYNERRWIPENLDYSKLLRGCREEDVTYTLLVKASIEVIDLTDDVTMIGECAVSYGTFADVWKGVWTDRQEKGTQHLVAVKALRATLVGHAQERLLGRLRKEVKAWHRLQHPHIAKLYGIVQLHNTIAMVSPWCPNGTIVKYLRDCNPNANRLQLLYEIASGVAYLHNRNPTVIHGDLKGCNILVNDEGRAVITDFGLAKVKEEVSDVAELPTSFFAGSTRWMAPELLLAQIEDEGARRAPITTYTDVYATASVCLEILTGQLPYPNRRNDHAVTLDIMRGVKPSRGSHYLVDVGKTAELWDLMDMCWDEIPRSRPTISRLCECLDGLRACV